MKLAVMQPYFLPYIGYFQLINAVDIFLLYDDVNYIMRGWINRNRILLNNEAYLFSIPIEKPSQNKLINETRILFNEKDRINLLKTIQLAYKKAPMFDEIYPMIEDIIKFNDTDLTRFIQNSIIKISNYADIKTKIIRSSGIEKNNSLTGEEKILEICKQLYANIYINSYGGYNLYSTENFDRAGINLKFIKPKLEDIVYKQYNQNFIENLSILDILMFCKKDKIKKFLEAYDLVSKRSDFIGKFAET